MTGEPKKAGEEREIARNTHPMPLTWPKDVSVEQMRRQVESILALGHGVVFIDPKPPKIE